MKFDRISIAIILILIVCLIASIWIYYDYRVQECTSNPLLFAGQKYTNEYGSNAYGKMYFLELGYPEIYFNSTAVHLEYPKRY